MALDATPGGASANSYITVADADAYSLECVGLASYKAKSSTEKAAALIEATRLLDMHVQWYGHIADISTQRLRWPRSFAYDLDGRTLSSTEIPQAIKDLTVEFADWLLENDGFDIDENTMSSVVVGGTQGVKVDFESSMRSPGFPKKIRSAIANWGVLSLSSGDVHAVRLERA